MDLVVLYNRQEQKRKADATFYGMTLTPKQVEMYKALKEAAESGRGYLNPASIGAGRQSGKTIVLLKLAKDLNKPLVVFSELIARDLRNRFPDIQIITNRQASRLRGSGIREVLVDECVNLGEIDPSIRILTGIHGRYYRNEFIESNQRQRGQWSYDARIQNNRLHRY